MSRDCSDSKVSRTSTCSGGSTGTTRPRSEPFSRSTRWAIGRIRSPAYSPLGLVEFARQYVERLHVLVCSIEREPIAALLTDLKQRGLLERTLVVWGGEFGRLPIAQRPENKDERSAGRDHNKHAMLSWLAGGGVKQGFTYGATDELGFAAFEDRVNVPDFHATILHLLGRRHEDLFFLRNGLKNRLTGVNHARLVHGLLA